MFCSKCGEKNDEGTMFCSECGTKVDVQLTKNAGKEPAKKESFITFIIRIISGKRAFPIFIIGIILGCFYYYQIFMEYDNSALSYFLTDILDDSYRHAYLSQLPGGVQFIIYLPGIILVIVLIISFFQSIIYLGEQLEKKAEKSALFKKVAGRVAITIGIIIILFLGIIPAVSPIIESSIASITSISSPGARLARETMREAERLLTSGQLPGLIEYGLLEIQLTASYEALMLSEKEQDIFTRELQRLLGELEKKYPDLF